MLVKQKLRVAISYLLNVILNLNLYDKHKSCKFVLILDVIHTVGPQGEKPTFLSQCYQNSLNLMLKNKLKTVAFPCISTGVYNYPNEPAAHVAVHEVRKFLEENESIDRVIFCVFLDRDLNVYQGILQSYFPIV